MSGALRYAYLLVLAVWLGTIVCFSFVVAPAVFRTLGPVQAGDMVGAVLGPYYRLGQLAGVLTVIGALLLGRRAAARSSWRAAAFAHAIGLAATLWAGRVVLPATQKLRASLVAEGTAPASSPEFARLHRRAVGLNGVALVAGLLGLGCASAALRE